MSLLDVYVIDDSEFDFTVLVDKTLTVSWSEVGVQSFRSSPWRLPAR